MCITCILPQRLDNFTVHKAVTQLPTPQAAFSGLSLPSPHFIAFASPNVMKLTKLKGIVAIPLVFFVSIAASSVSAAFGGFSYFFIRPFSLPLHRQICVNCTYAFFLISNFLLEVWSSIKIRTYGQPLPPDKTLLIVINHVTDVDWLLGLAHLSRMGYPSPGNAKCAVKAALGKVPLFGTILRLAEFSFLTREWSADRLTFLRRLHSLRQYPEHAVPFFFVLYPEGTRISPDKLNRSKRFAESRGQPPLTHVLYPRFKAFTSISSTLRDRLHGIVDATYIFEGRRPSLIRTLAGTDDCTVHAHARFYPIADVPEGEEAMEKWLVDRWYEKNKLIADFEKDSTSLGSHDSSLFPIQSPSLTPLYALIVVFTISASFTIYFFSTLRNGVSILFTLVLASVVVIAAVTTYAARPSSKGRS